MIDDRKLVTSNVLILYINVDEGLRDYNPKFNQITVLDWEMQFLRWSWLMDRSTK